MKKLKTSLPFLLSGRRINEVLQLKYSDIAITEARYANKSKYQASRVLNAFNDIIG